MRTEPADQPGQDPPSATIWGSASPAHCSSQVAPLPQLSEQLSVQVTLHTESAPQLTLPLLPTVTSQDAFASQVTLQDSPQLPLQTLCSAQSSEQLSGPQSSGENSQSSAAPQLQLWAAQTRASGSSSLQAKVVTAIAPMRMRIRFMRDP